MSIDNNSKCVRSKYFAGKPAMDESLSDFQEAKQSTKGPKTTKKPAKSNTRRATKRIKGQKDIRTALKGKKDDLITYSKEFDNVCKKSGLDVDSEQLQLAIALSKSLQTESSEDASTSQSLSTQGRIAKIRTTLQEYGFKVPETKITNTKRGKKRKNHYKLLNITDEERQQKVSSKYSQILFQSVDCSTLKQDCCSQEFDTPIINIATTLSYELMKDNNIFYVVGLVEKSTSTGCLLRDWSEIPGRPVSPLLFDTNKMDFSEIVCSQGELDVILSGSIKSAKDIVATKHKATKPVNNSPGIIIENEQLNKPLEKEDNVYADNSIILQSKERVLKLDKEVNRNEIFEIMGVESYSNLTSREQYRSCSPDIFDDEVSDIVEPELVILSQGQKTKVFAEEANHMDFTECANVLLAGNSQKSQMLSQNVTKRKSNDLMEITECAVSASQGILPSVKKIDLTQSPEENCTILKNDSVSCNNVFVAESPDNSMNDNSEVIIAGHFENNDQGDHIDLTQSFFEGDHKSIDHDHRTLIENKKQVVSPKFTTTNHYEVVTIGNLENKNNHEMPIDDIDLTQSSNEDDNKSACIQEQGELENKNTESMDLTQSSKSSVDIDDLPEVNVCSTQSQYDLDDTIILIEKEYIGINDKTNKSVVEENQVFDLTQAKDKSADLKKLKEGTNLQSQSIFDDFVHDHSGSKENSNDIEISNDNVLNTSKENEGIDLTQSSDESRDTFRPVTAFENVPNQSSLGKKDDVSIDYDEICEYESGRETSKETENDTGYSNNLKYDSSKSQVDNNDLVSNSSQNSEVFDLTDKELNYSLHKSKFDEIDHYHVDFGGISVMDNVSGVISVKHSLDPRSSVGIKNDTLGETFLPEVNIRKTEDKCIENTNIGAFGSKIVNIGENIVVPMGTPKNCEYIIKTDEVTPMLDYGSMTTPQRNKELNKYGLKPFKRKRAIQILTHIYNQTHPVVASYSDEDQPSPSKKAKQDTNIHTNSPRLSSPMKANENSSKTETNYLNSKSPRKAASSGNSLHNAGTINIASSKSPRKIERDRANVSSPRKKGTGTRNSRSPKKAGRNVNSPRKEGNSSKENNAVNEYKISSEKAIVKNVDCSPDDWVFQKKEKAKVYSCRVPLHIAFHNYVASRRSLREAILKYEPVNIDVIHKDLVSYGHRYDPKDLLRFLDKKCITVKTADNARNKR